MTRVLTLKRRIEPEERLKSKCFVRRLRCARIARALRGFRNLALFATLIVSSSASYAQQQPNFTLARGRIGALRIGMTAAEMAALFGQERVKQVDLHLEGMSTPALEIRLGDVAASRPSMTAEVFPSSENRIWRVNVFDRRFRTEEGLGIGSTLAEIRSHHRVRMQVGEGNVEAHVDELQMSFDFGSRWYPSTRLPASARVSSVCVLLSPEELPR